MGKLNHHAIAELTSLVDASSGQARSHLVSVFAGVAAQNGATWGNRKMKWFVASGGDAQTARSVPKKARPKPRSRRACILISGMIV